VKVEVARSETVNRLTSMRLSSVTTCTHLAGACLAFALPARPGHAEGSCTLLVRLDRPEPAWEAAATELRPRLDESSGDCRTVEIIVRDDTARVVFTTMDGRKAARTIREPRDLAPTVSALLVELPGGVAKPPPAPLLEPAKAASSPPAEARPNARANSPHVLLNGAAGARFAGPSPLVTATIDAGATLSLSGWDLGVLGTWCPGYVSLSDDVTRPATLSSLGAGVIVGRRGRVGRSLSLLGGVSLAAAFEHENWDVVDGSGRTTERESERGQMLVGAYGGVAFPAQWTTHFVSTLGVDLDATHAGHAATTIEGAPELPWWGLSLALGVESEVL
jgi:hypothetical protein